MTRPSAPAKATTPAKPLAKTSAPSSSRADGAGVDPALVREIAQALVDTNLTEIEVRRGDLRIRVSRQLAAAPIAYAPPVSAPAPAAASLPAVAPAAAKSEKASLADHPGVVTSPMVGTAYGRPNPNAKAFVEIGSKVAAGDKVFLVEAMKTFNEVVAHKGGVVSQILVEDGQPVEYGQPMLVID
jgi:acetyl-CoA carboxylase biotin carboxyl carrier protein